MKIGVLTYHCQPNFGAQLQAISNVGYLKRHGYDVIMIDWYAKDLQEMYSRRIPQEQLLCHETFTKWVFPLSRKCQTEQELIDEIEELKLDAILVGSDALFKFLPVNSRSHIDWKRLRRIIHFTPLSCELLEGNPFFGAFLGKLKRKIPASVYAASSQNCPFKLLSYKERKTMKESLSNYQKISVRDIWTQRMIKSITRRQDIPINPDPVFSFNQNCYLPILSKTEILKKYNLHPEYVLLSFGGKRCDAAYVKSLSIQLEGRGFQPVILPMPEGLFCADIPTKVPLPLTPLEWYALIVHSHGYIGERMHPIVVCLHNAIPFFSFDEYGSDSRVGLFHKKEEYNIESSKTYLIINDAGLNSNHYAYRGSKPLPSPKYVVEQLTTFCQERCAIFANRMLNAYNEGIENILQSLAEK